MQSREQFPIKNKKIAKTSKIDRFEDGCINQIRVEINPNASIQNN